MLIGSGPGVNGVVRVAPQHGRIMEAYIKDQTKIEIACRRLYCFEQNETAPFELFYRWFMGKPIGVEPSEPRPNRVIGNLQRSLVWEGELDDMPLCLLSTLLHLDGTIEPVLKWSNCTVVRIPGCFQQFVDFIIQKAKYTISYKAWSPLCMAVVFWHVHSSESTHQSSCYKR